MVTFRIKENRVKSVATVSSLAFLCLAALYFSPAEIGHKISFPLAVLSLASLWLCPWQVTAALTFSAIGDFMGSCDSFIGQMGFFAIGHIFYIIHFTIRYFRKVEPDRKLTGKAKGYLGMVIFCALILLTVTFVRIVPQAPAGIIRTGVCIYACLICLMMVMAMLQRSSLYALGAILFVFSDFILAWNMFVGPIEGSGLMIMIPYYLGQWLLFIRSAAFRVGPEMRLMRF